ncbi:MAG: DUF5011 domain-containing protein [Mariprofundales bacterium]
MAACGPNSSGGGNGANTITGGAIITGSVGDGPITGALVIVTDSAGNEMARTTSDSSAKYQVHVPTTASLPLTINFTGGIDLVTGKKPSIPITSMVVEPLVEGGAIVANGNPFSTLIVGAAVQEAAIQQKPIDTTILNQARDRIVKGYSFGLDPSIDPIRTPATSSNAAGLVQASEALAEVIRRSTFGLANSRKTAQGGSIIPSSAGQQVQNTVNILAADVIDGVVDGRAPARNATAGKAPSLSDSDLQAAFVQMQFNSVGVLSEVLTNTLAVTSANSGSIVQDQATGQPIANATAQIDSAVKTSTNGAFSGSITNQSSSAAATNIATQINVAINASKTMVQAGGGSQQQLTTLDTIQNQVNAAASGNSSALQALTTTITDTYVQGGLKQSQSTIDLSAAIVIAAGNGQDTTKLSPKSASLLAAANTASNDAARIGLSLPTLTSVTMISSNVNSSLAKSGDTITIHFSASKTLNAMPTATIAGQNAMVTNATTVNAYTAVYTMATGDAQGVVALSIHFTDAAGNAGSVVTSTTDGSTVTFDATLPTLNSVSIASNNGSNNSNAVAGDTITLTFAASEALLAIPTVMIAGNLATTVSNGKIANSYSSTYIVTANDTLGLATMAINFSDAAGNGASAVTTTSDGSSVTIAAIPPTLTTVSISSNNGTNSSQAKAGDIVNINFTASTPLLGMPSATIAGQTATIANGSSINSYAAAYALSTNDIEGTVAFAIVFSDAAGTAGTAVTATTDGSTVLFDRSPPVITLNGNNPLMLNQDGSFTDPGASVSDNYASGLVATIGGSVNTAVPGNYTRTYDATDGLGNTAITLSRIVKVNGYPTFSANLNQTVAEASSLTLTPTDPEGDSFTLTLSGTGNPSFATIVGGNTLQISPGFMDSGSHSITVSATDALGAASTTTFNLTVSNTDGLISTPLDSYAIVSTFAGNGTLGISGDGGQATVAQLDYPTGIAVDLYGNVYISSEASTKGSIRKVDATGTISTIAGFSTSFSMTSPRGLTFDSYGDLYVADVVDNIIRKIMNVGQTSQIMTTVAGTGIAGATGDNGLATQAKLTKPTDVLLDKAGNLYIADSGNNRIRKVDNTGVITTVADGNTTPTLISPSGIAFGLNGDLAIATASATGVFIINPSTGATTSPTIQGGMVLSPYNVAYDHEGNLYMADFAASSILKVDILGVVTAFMTSSLTDGSTITTATISKPFGIAITTNNVMYVSLPNSSGAANSNIIRQIKPATTNHLPTIDKQTVFSNGIQLNATDPAKTLALTGLTVGAASETLQTLSVSASSSNTALVNGVSIAGLNPTTGTATLNFAPVAAGTATITIVVRDGTISGVTTKTLKVTII